MDTGEEAAPIELPIPVVAPEAVPVETPVVPVTEPAEGAPA